MAHETTPNTLPDEVAGAYEPFARGVFPVGVRTIPVRDTVRNRLFPCEIWYPAAARHAGRDLSPETQDTFTVPSRGTSGRQSAVRDASPRPGTYPLIVFSHASGHHRRGSTFLCTHLSSHGYVVGALDHSEVVAPELARRDGETEDQRAARAEAMIASRVPDVRFLLDRLFNGSPWDADITLSREQIGIVGHSFGGWTALATPEADRRIRTVVALAPGGSSRPKPGILPGKLSFNWGRRVPALYLVAENDTPLPLDGMLEIFERAPAPKQMVILRRADHAHFMDDVAREHETVRTMTWPEMLAWLPKGMRPIAELCSEEQAHLFVRGLTLCHMDAVLRNQSAAKQFLWGDIEGGLARRGVEVIASTFGGTTLLQRS